MNLIDDHPPYGSKMFLHPLPDQYRLKSLRRGDQHVWRALGLSRPSTRWRIPMTHLDLHIEVPSHLFQASQEVPVQRAEWRNIETRRPMTLHRTTLLVNLTEDGR